MLLVYKSIEEKPIGDRLRASINTNNQLISQSLCLEVDQLDDLIRNKQFGRRVSS